MRRLGLIVALLLGVPAVLFLAIVLTTTFFLDRPMVRDIVATRLSNWSGGQLTMSGPLRLTYFPFILFEAQEASLQQIRSLPNIRQIRARRVAVRIRWWPLVFGQVYIDRVELDEPRILLRERPRDWKPVGKDDLPPILKTLKQSPIPHLVIRNGVLNYLDKDGNRSEISHVSLNAFISAESGNLEASGSFRWRKETVQFSVATHNPAAIAGTARAPLTLTLESPSFTAEITGEVAVIDGFQLGGKIRLTSSDLPHVLHWLGAGEPRQRSPRTFSVTGDFSWIGKKLAFEAANFQLDDNSADGALTLMLSGKRPLIEGTLAFKNLDLAPYLAQGGKAPSGKSPKKSKSVAKGGVRLAIQRLMGLLAPYHTTDMDIRISAANVHFPPLNAETAAFSLTSKSRRLTLNVAEVTLAKGSLSGTIVVQPTKASYRYAIKAQVTGLDLSTLADELVQSTFPLSGKIDAKLDLVLEGGPNQAPAQWLLGLEGNVTGKLGEGGLLPFDFRPLFSAPVMSLEAPAKPVRLAEMPVTRLSYVLKLQQGKLVMDPVVLDTEAGRLTGGIALSLVTREISGRLFLSSEPVSEKTKAKTGQENVPKTKARKLLILSGQLFHPLYRLLPADMSQLQSTVGNSVSSPLPPLFSPPQNQAATLP